MSRFHSSSWCLYLIFELVSLLAIFSFPSMKPSALPYLCCISCHGDLELQIDKQIFNRLTQNYEIISGSLTCPSCKKMYPIREGVPRFVDQEQSSETDMHTGHRFALSWKEFPRLTERYWQQLFDWLHPVYPAFLQDKVILEAGCGKGRHAKIVAEAGAKQVFGIDIGDAVDVAYQNVGHLPRVNIVQADIRWPPFRPIFDFAFSVGVLHHMDSPALGFAQIVRCLKPDGSVCIWVYGLENNWWLIYFINPIRELVTSKLPPPVLRLISMLLAIPVYLWAKLVAHPWKELSENLSWWPPLFYQDYMSYIAKFDFNEIHHIVFDHLVTPVAFYLPGKEVAEWFNQANLKNAVVRWHNSNSWTGFGSFHPEAMEAMRARVEGVSATIETVLVSSVPLEPPVGTSSR